MALPPSLVANTSPIVDKALETGARGQTITKTDYGVIGDAMFKKAHLDLGIANLRADMGIQKARLQSDIGIKSAEILGGLEMQRANLMQNEANIKFDAQFKQGQLALEQNKFDWEKKQAKKEEKVGDFEKIMGVATGALGGVAAGAAFGPPGMIAGGVLGGGLAYAGAQSGGRKGMQAALQFTDTAAAAIPKIKQMHDENVYKDVVSASAKEVDKYNSILKNPNSSPEQRDMAATKLSEVRSKVTSAAVKAGYNPQQSSEAGSAVVDDNVASSNATASTKAKYDLAQTVLRSASDARTQSNDPNERKQARDEYLAQANAAYAQMSATEKQGIGGYKTMVASVVGTQGMADLRSLPVQTQVNPVMQPQPANPSPNRPISQPTARPLEPRASAQPVAPQSPQATGSQGASTIPQREQAPPPSRATGAFDQSGGVPVRPEHLPQGPGIEMDTLQDPVGQVQQLSKQGAEAAKVLSKDGGATGSWQAPAKAQVPSKNNENSERIATAREKLKGSDDKITSDVARQGNNGSKAIQNMRKIVASDNFPAGSTRKNIAAKVYKGEAGEAIGTAVGATAGAVGGGVVAGPAGAFTGMSGGAAAGNRFGKNLEVGKGMDLGQLNDKEKNAIMQVDTYKSAVITTLAKGGDPGSAVREFEAEGWDKLLPSPAKSREQNLSDLDTLESLIADRMESEVEVEVGGGNNSEEDEEKRLDLEYKRKRNNNYGQPKIKANAGFFDF